MKSISKIPKFDVSKQITDHYKQIIKQLRKQIKESISKAIYEKIEQPIKQVTASLRKRLAEVSEKQRKVQYHCIRTGWYLSYLDAAIAGIIDLADMIDNEQFEKVELEIQGFARTRVDKTLQQIQSNWPTRLEIIRDAFQAHRQGLYTLSIPVLLAQADGISEEIFGVQLYKKEQGKPKTREVVEQFENQYCDWLIEPLRIVTSIAVNTKDRDKKREKDPLYGPLNRHGVLHGIDIDYATEANSLRAIMLINYLSDIKQILDTNYN
jgi:hypothetical protein